MFPQDEDSRSPASFCLSTNQTAAPIYHHCEKDKQNKQRRSRSSYPFRSQSQTPLSHHKLPQYSPAIIPGLYQDQRPVLWHVIWNVDGAEVWRQTPERQGGDVSSSVRTPRRFEYSVLVASIQRKDGSPRDYERMFRPPLRPTLPRRRRFLAPTHTKLQWTKPFLESKPEARRCYTKQESEGWARDKRSQTAQPYRQFTG
jgi:hypothetical protein